MFLTYNEQQSRFLLWCDYSERALPKERGFLWDEVSKIWFTKETKIAEQFTPIADHIALRAFHYKSRDEKETILKSLAATSNLSVPAPTGLNYLPYQVAGIEQASRWENCLLADEMGLGKTIQAIGVINLHDIRSVLVVCPASLKLNWERELRKWLTKCLTVSVATPKKLTQADVVIINYDILGKFREKLAEREWELLIGDEAHYVKNTKAIRSKNFYGLQARKTLLLTGTPICNKPEELWPLIHKLKPDVFRSYRDYAARYCAPPGTKPGGGFAAHYYTKNLEELQTRLRTHVMVRRLKSDVLSELPPKVRQIIELPAASKEEEEAIHQEELAFKERNVTLEKLRAAVKDARSANDTKAYKAAVDKLRSGMGALLSEISEKRKTVALLKIPYVVEHLTEIVDSGNKVVVFAHHHIVIDRLHEKFKSCAVSFDGRKTMQERDEAITKFQTDEGTRIFIGGITAAGVGITLTASSHVVFAELDWVPGNVNQCEDRCHRIGQANSVLVQHLVMEGSLDLKIAKTLIDKQELIDRALNRRQDATT